jgi:spore coat polysaccharide biosynthesis protein SpsF
MRVGAIIQCRFLSTRLPYKCLHKFPNGDTLLDQVIKEAKKVRHVDEVILAVPKEEVPDMVFSSWEEHASRHNIYIHIYNGNKDDVISRFNEVCKVHKYDYVLRVTADDPFRNPDLADIAIRIAMHQMLEYVQLDTTCYGEGCEVLTSRLIEVAHRFSSDREHISDFIKYYVPLDRAYHSIFPSSTNEKSLTVDTGADWDRAVSYWRKLNEQPIH